MTEKEIIVKQEGKINSTFKVKCPKKIEFWKMIEKQNMIFPLGFVKTRIIKK